MSGDNTKKIEPGEIVHWEPWVADILAKHRAMLEAMNHGKIFDCQHGKITINMHEGHVQSVTVENRTYQHVATGNGIPRALP